MELKTIKGIGPKKEKLLNKLEIYNTLDLVEYYPRDYEDRTKIRNIENVTIGEFNLLKLKIISPCTTSYPRRRMSITTCKATDGYNNINLKWFNNPYIKNSININDIFYAYGKISKIGRIIEMDSPILEKKFGNKIGKIYPLYSLTEGLTNNDLVNFVSRAIESEKIQDIIPINIAEKNNLISRKLAIRNIHFPENINMLVAARKTLKFEELLILQTTINLDTINIDKKGIKFKDYDEVYSFIDTLPFILTDAQNRVLDEIFKDMNSDNAMNRLVQGDVGSGKTVIAAVAMIKAYYNGYQSAMMAPTEILATQHYKTLKDLLKDTNINIALLKGSLTASKKEEIYAELKNGNIDILVGTHAIIEDVVEFKNIGMVITDEQHRFGVKQRAKMTQKGENPDTLIMTATPIPRTLTLVMYGDLDISVIDSLPPGRKEIDTFAVNMNYEERVIKFIKKQLNEGRQGYIVCPLIEESEKLELNSVLELYERLKNDYFQDTEIAFIHGKMKNDEKDMIMNKFINSEVKVLFSTTVIEVGVNVVNANIMVIYNAERFGLSQLHQLRGRVGRGNYKSYCVLINGSYSKVSRERMRIMESSNDGFLIAKKDLELRGSGDIIGTKQSGLPSLKIANIYDDIKLLEIVQPISKNIVKKNLLAREDYKNLNNEIYKFIDKINNNIIFN